MNNSSILSPGSALYESVFRDYYGRVFGYIFSKVSSRQDAEDITADVFEKVFKGLDRFDEKKASLSTWIYKITSNTLTDHFRTHRVLAEIPETMDAGICVEAEALNNEMLEALAKALESLEERERDIIIMRFYSGKTLKDIAGLLGISYAYVKVLQNRAFVKLKKYLS